MSTYLLSQLSALALHQTWGIWRIIIWVWWGNRMTAEHRYWWYEERSVPHSSIDFSHLNHKKRHFRCSIHYQSRWRSLLSNKKCFYHFQFLGILFIFTPIISGRRAINADIHNPKHAKYTFLPPNQKSWPSCSRIFPLHCLKSYMNIFWAAKTQLNKCTVCLPFSKLNFSLLRGGGKTIFSPKSALNMV